MTQRMWKQVIKPLEVTTTKADGLITAEAGDTLVLSNKDSEHYYIHRVNSKDIFSTWMRKKWVDAHCQ